MENYLNNIFKEVDKNIILDNFQKQAVLENDSNLMIIAGAGSGKTTTMGAKVKYLIDKLNVDPKDILVLSFTNKSTQEINNLINKKFNFKNVDVKTFHKLGFDIIKNQQNYKLIKDDCIYKVIAEYIEKIVFVNKKLLLKNIKFFNNFYNFKKSSLFYKDFNKYSKLNNKKNSFYYDKFIKNIAIPFINLVKTHDIKLDFKKNDRLLKERLKILNDIYLYYNRYLQKNNLIDFNDMIAFSTKLIEQKETILNYKYIIVDEYQDISYLRFNLIKSIYLQTKAKVMVVGDDWQAIFKFAGSDLNLFTSFNNFFFNSKQISIVNTYRNSQELIDIAGKFVMKNNLQIQKKLISNKSIINPVIISYYYSDYHKCLKVKSIIDDILKINICSTILIMGRYNRDINFFKSLNCFKIINNTIVYNNIVIDFLTVHSSKGLGYDYCILVNNSTGKFGFPSEYESIDCLTFFDKSNEAIDFPEERRLFYVALTRTKNQVFLLTPLFKESIFIKEIINYPNVKVDLFLNNNFFINYFFKLYVKMLKGGI